MPRQTQSWKNDRNICVHVDGSETFSGFHRELCETRMSQTLLETTSLEAIYAGEGGKSLKLQYGLPRCSCLPKVQSGGVGRSAEDPHFNLKPSRAIRITELQTMPR